MFKRTASISDSPGAAKWQHGISVLALLFGATMWGISWYPVRLLEATGLHGLWVSLFIYLGTLVLSLPVLLRQRNVFWSHIRALFILAIAIGWLNISFILAVLEGQVVRVLLLFYLSPLWASLLGWLVLGERLKRGAWLVMLTALGGAVIMFWNPQQGLPLPQNRAEWLALSSGFCFAFANMMIRKLDTVPVEIKTVTGWLGVIVVAMALIMISGVPAPQVTMSNVPLAMLYGLLGISIMTFAVVYGVSKMPIHRSSVILLFEIVAGSVSAVWLAGEVIQTREWLGGSLVMLAAYLSARKEIEEQ